MSELKSYQAILVIGVIIVVLWSGCVLSGFSEFLLDSDGEDKREETGISTGHPDVGTEVSSYDSDEDEIRIETHALIDQAVKPIRNENNVSLPNVQAQYDAKGILLLEQGSISVWVRLQQGVYRRDHVILHSNDSRINLYLDTYAVSSRDVELTRIAAKVGGSRKALREGVPNMHVPEASLVFKKPGLEGYGAARSYVGLAPFPEGQWHFLTMTWDGWPMGLVSLYLDGKIVAQQVYDPRYEDDRPSMQSFADGVRPEEWLGEVVEGQDGIRYQLIPSTEISMDEGGIEIRDLRVYARGLNDYEIQDLYAETSDQTQSQ